MPRVRAGLGLLVIILVGFGCSSKVAGSGAAVVQPAGSTGDSATATASSPPNTAPSVPTTAPSGASASSASTPQLPTHGAPKVRHPLDPRAFFTTKAICTVLTPNQLHTFGIRNIRLLNPEITRVSASCGWADFDNGRNVDAIFELSLGGLTGIYEGHQQDPGGLAYFEPTEVDGYPAIFDQNVDERSSGFCELDVGISDSIYVALNAKLFDTKARCYEVARRMAGFVLRNIGAS
ncbi:MAG TPA: DUF3558 family protein [Mycobacteriales bacterium]|nr:DUF3558 family protein [Mycobacteriales bacterium]